VAATDSRMFNFQPANKDMKLYALLHIGMFQL
jgi:hypothetical protein